ncbi:unnamed protein product [Rhizophagus irregularis]|nr:unnamed protein product [Rhizophagus irregularis]
MLRTAIEKISEVYITSGQRSKKKCYEDKIEKESLGYINDLKSFVEKHDEKRNYDHMEDSQGHKESYKPNSDLHTPVPSKKAIRLMYHSTNTLLSLTPTNLYNKIMNLPTLTHSGETSCKGMRCSRGVAGVCDLLQKYADKMMLRIGTRLKIISKMLMLTVKCIEDTNLAFFR